MRIQKVKYEGLPMIYFACERYGHNSNTCKKADAEKNYDNVAQPPSDV